MRAKQLLQALSKQFLSTQNFTAALDVEETSDQVCTGTDRDLDVGDDVALDGGAFYAGEWLEHLERTQSHLRKLLMGALDFDNGRPELVSVLIHLLIHFRTELADTFARIIEAYMEFQCVATYPFQ